MYWSLVFCVVWLSASPTNGQRRAAVAYPVTLPEEVESVSENPLSSSINSIQTGKEELIGFHRGDPLLGAPYRRGYQKTTTPDYFKESATRADSTNIEKAQHDPPTKPFEVDAKAAVGNVPGSRSEDGVKVFRAYEDPTENRRSGLSKGERRSSSELPSSASSVRAGSSPKLDRSETERSSEKKDEVKESMDVANKGTSLREHTRRTNTHESRRQSTTQLSSPSVRYNTTVKDTSERHREEFPERNQTERLNSERGPTVLADHARGHRTVTRSTSDKGQILTHTSTPRILAGPRYDRTEHPSVSTGAHDRKAPDRPIDSKDSSFRSADEKKKDLDGASDLHDKVYQTENEGGSKVREDRTNSTVINKPTHLLIGEERLPEASKSPDIYRDEFRAGGKDDSSGKVSSDTEKPSGGGEGKIYVERPYVRDDEERSPSLQGRDTDRDYTRRQRDRYDERSYEERPPKDRQAHRDRERNVTYNSQGRTASRSSRPRDRGYDEEYRDDVYSQRDVVKDSGSIPSDRKRVAGRRPYTRTDDDAEDRDRYVGDNTRTYRDYSDDRRYRDERVSTDRDSSRRYDYEDRRKYRDNSSRTYDDDDYGDDKDRYNRRYEKDGESVRYGDDGTRRYTDSVSRRYEDEETRRFPTEYDRSVRRYKDDDEYTYNSTQRYRDNYDGYRNDNRRSSGESGSSSRYDESDGARSSRYDDEEYIGSGSYRARDSDRKYVRRDNEGNSRQRDVARKYVADDASGYREADEDRRYRDETRVYGQSSPKDRYDQDNRRTLEGNGSVYGGTRPYEARLEPNARGEYDDMSRHRDNNGSRRSRGDESYRSRPYDEDEYYINRTSTGYVDRYDETGQPKRRTDDSLGFASSDGDSRKYIPGSSDERRRDRDSVYADIPVSRRPTDTDDTRREKSRVYDEDSRTDRSRVDSYDDRTYRSRDDDEYIRSSKDRVKDYDTRVYRDSDDEADTRSYRVRGDGDLNDRYKGDGAIRGRVTDDELKMTRPVVSRSRDKDYVDRRYEEEYRDKDSEGTYRYREDDERYKNTPPEGRKPEYSDTERRNRGTQRFRDDYDAPYERDLNVPRSADERRRGGSRSNRREDRFTGDRADVDDKVPERPSTKVDTAVRHDTKPEFPASRNDESLLKGDRSSPYDEESRRDGTRSPSRDILPDVRIPRTPYTSDDKPLKPRVPDDSADSFDKGDFARGRRTSFYNEDDKIDSDRDEGAKRTRDDRQLSRTGDNEELSYTRGENDRDSAGDTKGLRQSDRPNSRPSTEGRAYSDRRDNSDTSRHRTKGEMQSNSGMPSDVLPSSNDKEYSERPGDIAKPTISQSNEEAQRRRYSSSTYDRGSRRRLPNVRESEADRTKRRDESEYKSEDSLLPENRGRYRYTKSRGDPEDFVRRPDEESFAAGDEYISRGTDSKVRDADRRDMLKGEYGSPGSGIPTRNKEDRIPTYTEDRDKEEYYPSSRDKAPPSRSGKPVDDARAQREFDRREKVPQDRDNVGRGERGMYGNGEYPRSSSPRDEMKFSGENTTRDHFESSGGEVRVKKENDPISPVLLQTAPGVRGQGSSVSRTATPIPYYQDKEFISRNASSKSSSGVPVTREKRFQYDDRASTNNTSRSVPATIDELSKRPLTTKEVIEAAYRHSDEPEKQREIFYPVYVPGSSNMTSPDVIRPSERRGITTPTKKKKKK